VRVLHLTTEFPPIIYGGLGTATGGLVSALARASVDVAVLLLGPATGSSYGQFRPLARYPAAQVRRYGGVTIFEVSWFLDLESIIRIVKRWRPDILHLHSFWMWHIAGALRQRLNVPLVYTVHSLDRAEYELGAGPPQCVGQWTHQESAIYGADRIICLTESEQELLSAYCPSVRERIRIIGNGIDDVSYRRPTRPRDRPPTVLFSGRFVARKGIHELMDAIGIVLAQLAEVRFVLAGGHRDASAEQMEAWLLTKSLSPFRSQIHFTGWLTPRELEAWYRSADILVVPSWYEPFGMVVLEGMIHGLAVAASDVGGPAEIIRHGETGLLFPAGDAGALAGAIIELVYDSKLRGRLSSQGAIEVRETWIWDKVVPRMHAVYTEAARL
jgi:glycogen(starch) synthase